MFYLYYWYLLLYTFVKLCSIMWFAFVTLHKTLLIYLLNYKATISVSCYIPFSVFSADHRITLEVEYDMLIQ